MKHKELDHFRQVLKQFENLVDKAENSFSAIELSKISNEAILHLREIQMCSPRLWDEFVNISRRRRSDISMGLVTMPKEDTKEISTPPNQAPTIVAEIKPCKKTAKKGKNNAR